MKRSRDSGTTGSGSELPFSHPTAPPTQSRRTLGVSNATLYVIVTVLTVGILLTLVNVYELRRLQTDHFVSAHGLMPEATTGAINQKICWVNAKNQITGYLKHVYAVLDRVGCTIGDKSSSWELLWSHEYPFTQLGEIMRNLQPHQKVNHFPGSGFITNKNSLATSPIKNIPKAFKLPEEKIDFLAYVKKNDNNLWVQKSNTHRGIRVKRITELDLDADGSFVQKFISNPLLVDQRKFDIGVYTVLTSIDPLLVYVMDTEALYRYCPKDYHPFNAENVDKYVVGDDYTPTWEIPSLKKLYTTLGYNHKDSLDTYLRQNGYNVSGMWREIYSTIREVYLVKEPNLIDAAKNYKTTSNFFEMVRFDFVIDEHLKPFLMEVNMSPNLSSNHFTKNRILYEQVLMSLFSLVGLARPTVKDIQKSDSVENEMQVADHDIAVNQAHCSSQMCEFSCDSEGCSLCLHCLTEAQKKTLKKAYLEHSHRHNMRRVIPEAMDQDDAISGVNTNQRYSPSNQLMSGWFRAKCIRDASWCN